ncbi:MAG: hypothetical protein IMW91_03825 [Firmicutes bacterium]|nr:hypothetical protein [Bacillota bacterium]
MRVTALILGILGGITGLIAVIFVLFVEGIGHVFQAEGAETVLRLGWAAIPLSIVGIVGGGLSLGKPTVFRILQLISGIGGLIVISLFFIPATIMLVVGAVLAFFGRKEVSPKSSDRIKQR